MLLKWRFSAGRIKALTFSGAIPKFALRKGISLSKPKQEENSLRLQLNNRISRGAVVAVIAAGSMLIVSALSTATAATPSSARKSANKLVLAALQDPGTLDVVKQNQTALVLWLPGNVYETLVTNKPDGTTGPGVAKSWVISTDQLTYTFNIRDAKFSNGATITADDVVYSLNAMKNGPIGSYHGPFAQVKTIKATDAKTVVITLGQSSRSLSKFCFPIRSHRSIVITGNESISPALSAASAAFPSVIILTVTSFIEGASPQYWVFGIKVK